MTGVFPDVETRLAEWLVDCEIDAISSEAVSAAKACLLDAIGVGLAGTRTDVYAKSRQLAPQHGRYSLLGDNAGASDASSAAFLNGVAVHALDFDDTSYAGIVHGTAVVLPAVLAASELARASGKTVLEALIAGLEVEYALGLSLGDGLYNAGHWCTSTLGVIGAAAGAAKALRLETSESTHALRLAANLPLGLRVSHGSLCKPYLAGYASRLGFECALAAKAGITGTPGTVTGRGGLAATLNNDFFDDAPVQALGHRYSLVNPGVAFKLFPLCSATLAAIDAVLEMRLTHRLAVERIQSIECLATPLVVSCLPFLEPRNQSQAQFSMSFALACALLHGTVRFEHFSEDHLRSEPLVRLMSRVRLRAEPDLVNPEDRLRYPEAARVRIHLTDGSSLEHQVLAASGMPANQASPERLRSKFLHCSASAVPERRAHELLAILASPQSAASVAELVGSAATEKADAA